MNATGQAELDDQEERALLLLARGQTVQSIERELGCKRAMVYRMLSRATDKLGGKTLYEGVAILANRRGRHGLPLHDPQPDEEHEYYEYGSLRYHANYVSLSVQNLRCPILPDPYSGFHDS